MKKRYIVLIVIIILVLISILSLVVYNKIVENRKKYEIDEVKEYNYFVLRQNELYGVIDKKGNTVITPKYDKVIIPNPEKAIFVCYKDENTEVFNQNQEQILKEYNDVEPIRFKNISTDLMYEKSVLKYKKEDKYGIINFDGKALTDSIYDEIESLQYKEGELLVKQGEKYGVINIKGSKLVPIEYDEILVDEYYTDEDNYKYSGYIVGIKTEEGYRYGYLNSDAKEILEPQYNEMSRVTEIKDNENQYLICAKNGQYGVNKNNDCIIENEYQSIKYDENNQVFVIEKTKKYGIANMEGKIIVPIEFNQIDINGMYIYAQNEQGTTVYNANGEEVNIHSNIAILNTDNEKYKIKINSENGTKYGVINDSGKQLIEEKYNYIRYLYNKYFIASYENGKLGIIDDEENVKIELNNDSLQQIEGTQLIQTITNDTKMTAIYSKTLEKIYEMPDARLEAYDGYIKLYNDTETKYFDTDGKELKSTDVYPNNNIFVNVNENKYGFVDKKGNIIVENKYDKAYELNEYGFSAVKKDDKWGVINEKGEEVIEPTYTFEEKTEPFFIGQYYRVIYGLGEIYYTNAQ